MEKWFKEGYSIRDIGYIAQACAKDAELDIIMDAMYDKKN